MSGGTVGFAVSSRRMTWTRGRVEDLYRAGARGTRQRDLAGRCDEWKTVAPDMGDRDYDRNQPVVLGSSATVAMDGDQRPGDNFTPRQQSPSTLRPADQRTPSYVRMNRGPGTVSPTDPGDYQRNGRSIKGLVNVGRDGYLWFLERTNDKILSSKASRTLTARLQEPRSRDRTAGYRPDRTGTGKWPLLPAVWGGKDWPPIAFSPETGDLHSGEREHVWHVHRLEVEYSRTRVYSARGSTSTRSGRRACRRSAAWNVDTGASVTHPFATSRTGARCSPPLVDSYSAADERPPVSRVQRVDERAVGVPTNSASSARQFRSW